MTTADAVEILLVEDDEAHAELVCRAFESTPETNIRLAEDLRSAHAQLTDHGWQPDIIITDLRLPDGLGTDLLAGRDDLNGPPVVV